MGLVLMCAGGVIPTRALKIVDVDTPRHLDLPTSAVEQEVQGREWLDSCKEGFLA